MILDEIAAKAKERVENAKSKVSMEDVRRLAEELPRSQDYPFEQALRAPGLSFICEIKKASPSKGIIAEDFPYVTIGREYEAAGASAISVLTEPFYFLGSDQYLKEVAEVVTIPVLRKDFTVDPYMIYEAKNLGASAILLICSILEDSQMKEYRLIAEELGLSALVEAHDEAELFRAQKSGARIIGVNNRNLKTFEVDIQNSVRLRQLVSPEIVFVSESGMKCSRDTKVLYDNGTDAVLIGETLMRSPNKRELLQTLRF